MARRARAEAATSRAIASLEQKGLLVRERNRRTGRTHLRTAGQSETPEWEELALAEEDISAHCLKTARTWQELARRARLRAEAIRRSRGTAGTEAERERDLAEVARLSGERT